MSNTNISLEIQNGTVLPTHIVETAFVKIFREINFTEISLVFKNYQWSTNIIIAHSDSKN